MAKNRHIVREVEEGSIAEEMGICPGDELLAIGDQMIEDVFDYQFMIQDPYLEVLIQKGDSGEEWLLEIEKDPEEDLGITFESGLMDAYRHCSNGCIFCFIDQNPPGMRETLYFKDDDARLSFLQGNYVTLTNMRQDDVERIIRYRMEPINISFHTTDPELRCRMLRNRFAGESLAHVQRFADAGIEMNGQIVLCKGWNDGEALDRTIEDLSGYLPHLKSVSVVPVGLTKYREGLTELEPFDVEDARKVLAQIHAWQERLYPVWGTRLVHASDEWYLISDTPIPEAETYEGYPQLENGVGKMRLLAEEFREELQARPGDDRARKVTLVTGTLVSGFMEDLLHPLREAYPSLKIDYRPIRNDFYGERITVTGLVTGGDLIAQLKDTDLGEEILIPDSMLRAGEEVFLDDVVVADVEEALGIPAVIVDPDGADLCRCLLGEARNREHRRRQNYEQTDRSDRRPPERRKIDSF